jgi:hypothetical protein
MRKGISNNLISLFFFKCFYFINKLRGLTMTSIILSPFGYAAAAAAVF